MNRTIIALALSLGAVCLTTADAQSGCDSCGVTHTYRMVYQTVYDQRETTTYRLEYDTVYDERTITRYRPVWETKTEERHYRVAKQIPQTSMREEHYVVNRPVWETRQRQEHRTVMKPVTHTVYRTESHTVTEPVTTYDNVTVDQGCFVQRTVYKPGPTWNRLAWQSGADVIDPATGAVSTRRAGLHWVPVQQAGSYEVQRAWQPNLVTQQVARTVYMPKVITRQVPVEVCTYEPQRETRTVDYKVCRMLQEQKVRQIPVTHYQTVWEDRVQQIPVRTCKMEPYEETIRVARCVERRVPVTRVCQVPRKVWCSVPVDPCSGQAVQGGSLEAWQNADPGSTSPPDNPTPAANPADQKPKIPAEV